jgi:hypothetical protein
VAYLLEAVGEHVLDEAAQKRAHSAPEAKLPAPGNPLLSVREIESGSISHAARQHVLAFSCGL